MFVKIPEEILDADISASELRILANLIKYSLDNNHSYIGYSKLATACKMTKAHVINLIKQLQDKKFIKVTPRGAFSRSNDILLTLSEGLNMSGRQVGGLAADTEQGYKNYTEQRYKNYTEQGYKNYTEEYKNYTPYKEERFKNLDLKFKNGEEYKNYTPDAANKEELATADRAAVRSMPINEPSKCSFGGDFAAKDAEIAEYINLHYPSFNVWYSLFRTTSGQYRVYPVTPFISRIIPDERKIKTLPDGVILANTALPPSADFVKIL